MLQVLGLLKTLSRVKICQVRGGVWGRGRGHGVTTKLITRLSRVDSWLSPFPPNVSLLYPCCLYTSSIVFLVLKVKGGGLPQENIQSSLALSHGN